MYLLANLSWRGGLLALTMSGLVAAQGAAMAIEDGYVAGLCIAANPADPAAAFSRYETIRRSRIRRVAGRTDCSALQDEFDTTSTARISWNW